MASNKSGSPRLEVGIIGGSIAGCATAIELLRLEHDVMLFERTGEELKDRGAGIGIPSPTISTLIERDVLDADIPYFSASRLARLWRTPAEHRYGYLAWDQPADFALLNWGELYRNLRKRVPDRVYQTDRQVVSIAQQDNGVATVSLADGSIQDFDLIVCADGYASLGRRTLFPDCKLEYAGYVIWRGFMFDEELSEMPPLERGVHFPGYPGGHGILFYAPGPDGSVTPGRRLVNWLMYIQVAADEMPAFLTDKAGQVHDGSLPRGAMPLATEGRLKRAAHQRLPDYYAEIVEKSFDTFVYAIYDCSVPAYHKGRICLAGDAGAFARPHTVAGAFKSMNDAIALIEALKAHQAIDEALEAWDVDRTALNNRIVAYGGQLGRALVQEIPDWSKMNPVSMEAWFNSVVTLGSYQAQPI